AQGIVTAPAFVANHSRGSFQVTATAPGIGQPTIFTLTNVAAPTTTNRTGNNQRARVDTPFAKALSITVLDAHHQPIRGLAVEFAVASDGDAGGTFDGATTVTTNASGVAAAPTLTANGVPGQFTVEAWVTGLKTLVEFTLSNTSVPAKVVASHGT